MTMEIKNITNSQFNGFKELNVSINEVLQNSFDSSSKSEINIPEITEDNMLNNLDTGLKNIIKKDGNVLGNTVFNDNQITNFNFFIISQKQILSQEDNNLLHNNNKETKKRGRKRKREDVSNDGDDSNKKTHNKFSDDNMRKNVRILF